jgi:hypothetical protein
VSVAAASEPLEKRPGKLGLSSTTDNQKEAVWRVEFEVLGEQFVLKNIKDNEAKRQAAFSWLSEQVQLRDRRERNAELAWRALFASMAAALVGIMATLIVLR